MEALVCKNCGANALTRKNDYLYCPYCDSRFIITKKEHQREYLNNNYPMTTSGGEKTAGEKENYRSIYHNTFSRSGTASGIALDDDLVRLLAKCKADPKNARKYANLILDIDPDNEEALNYLRK